MPFKHLEIPSHWEHYWTKYPEGYTILEALFNWVNQCNLVIDNVNDLNNVIEEFLKQFDSELEQTVRKMLDEMKENGELDYIIGQYNPFTSGRVSVLTFGAKGDGVTDDTQAIQQADDFAYLHNTTLEFPKGVYKCTDGLIRKAEWRGVGAPTLGVFPLEDEKVKLAPNRKTELSGTVLLFTGTGTQTHNTQRADEFSRVSYCVKTIPKNTTGMHDLAIVLDCDIKDADGNWTTPTTDNRANYDVGYFVDDSPRNIHTNIVVFGYFNRAGIVVHSKENVQGYEGDPDYCSFHRGSTMGYIGVALIGSEYEDSYYGGLSGTRFIDFQVFSNDHHSRNTTYDNWGKTCLLIDGFTSAINSEINGHYFNNCCIRTYGNNAIILDRASNVSFNQCVFELPKYGTTNSSRNQFLAGDDTRDISFITCRFSDGSGIYSADFSDKITKLIVIGEPYDSIDISNNSKGVRLSAENNPAVQFSSNLTSKVSDWVIQNEINNETEMLSFRYDNAVQFQLSKTGGFMRNGFAYGGTKTITNNSISIGDYSFYGVSGGTLTTITTLTDPFVGQRLQLRAATNSGVVTLNETGNMRLTQTEIVLNNSQDRVELEYDGQNWVMISFANNTTD